MKQVKIFNQMQKKPQNELIGSDEDIHNSRRILSEMGKAPTSNKRIKKRSSSSEFINTDDEGETSEKKATKTFTKSD